MVQRVEVHCDAERASAGGLHVGQISPGLWNMRLTCRARAFNWMGETGQSSALVKAESILLCPFGYRGEAFMWLSSKQSKD